MILFFVYTFIQVLHNLSMWSATDKVMTYDQAKADANKAKKDMKMVHTHTQRHYGGCTNSYTVSIVSS